MSKILLPTEQSERDDQNQIDPTSREQQESTDNSEPTTDISPSASENGEYAGHHEGSGSGTEVVTPEEHAQRTRPIAKIAGYIAMFASGVSKRAAHLSEAADNFSTSMAERRPFREAAGERIRNMQTLFQRALPSTESSYAQDLKQSLSGTKERIQSSVLDFALNKLNEAKKRQEARQEARQEREYADTYDKAHSMNEQFDKNRQEQERHRELASELQEIQRQHEQGSEKYNRIEAWKQEELRTAHEFDAANDSIIGKKK